MGNLSVRENRADCLAILVEKAHDGYHNATNELFREFWRVKLEEVLQLQWLFSLEGDGVSVCIEDNTCQFLHLRAPNRPLVTYKRSRFGEPLSRISA